MKLKRIEKIEKLENKYWIKITFEYSNGGQWTEYRSQWLPSFKELGKILRGIAECEDERYPFGQGREMMKMYLNDVLDKEYSDEDFDDLQKKYLFKK